jgi:hypothetical protein
MTLKDLITEADYAALRGVSPRTIQRERALRMGPAYIKLGKSIFYRPEAIEAWIIGQERKHPSAA